MGRRDYPDAEKIAKRAKKLRGDAGTQRTLDDQAINLYTQAHVIETPQRDADKPKAIGMGIVGGMVDRRVNIVGARPFARVLARGGQEAEGHASGTLEPWANTSPWIAQGDFEVWDTGVLDHQLIGEFYSKVLPAPQFWGDSTYMELVEEWNDLVKDGKDTDDVKERIRIYRRDNFPIVWRYVDATCTYRDVDERGTAGVYEFQTMTRADIEMRFPDAQLEEKREDFEVIHYANDVYVCTVFPGSGGVLGTGLFRDRAGFLGEPWAHGMGCNPYVRIPRVAMRANKQGHTRVGAAYHSREMVQSIDESTTDWRNVMRREVETPPLITMVPQLRARLGLDQKEMKITPNEPVILYVGPEGEEKAARYPTATVNPQLGQYIAIVGTYADRTGAWMPQLMGVGPSGESAVHQSTARQSAITGELEVPHRNLEEGFAHIVERFFRAVISLERSLPENAESWMREVTVRTADTKHKSREISVSAADVRKYEPMVRGKIQKNLPVNMGANVINARELTDPEHPLVDDNTVREMLLNIDNPQEIDDKIFQQRIRRRAEDAYEASIEQRMRLIADEFSDEEIVKLAEKMLETPAAAQEALLSEMGGEQGNRLLEQMTRGQANRARTGREQRMSRLRGTEQAVPEEQFIG